MHAPPHSDVSGSHNVPSVRDFSSDKHSETTRYPAASEIIVTKVGNLFELHSYFLTKVLLV